ncbi:MAG: PAS domain S-box protein [Candidatus Zixiibacteriota bacterium]|nr:MAG: PAS domain S-box protein [candidate division Zixibacteria bacterium]
MPEIKSPALLNRVSRFILIHILFVFIALALVLFYQDDENLLSRHYAALEQKIMSAASYLNEVIGANPNAAADDPAITAAITMLESENDFICHIELIPGEATGIPRNRQARELPYPPGSEFSRLQSREADGGQGLSVPRPGNRSVYFSADSKYISHLIEPDQADGKYAILIVSPNIIESGNRNDLAYLLLLLFLISALISLLLVYLIQKGIKQPLALLAEGFAATAEGKEYCVKQTCRDPDMRLLIAAFNNMSKSLAEKQRQLTNANRKLVKTNKSLKESESFLTALIDYSPDAIIVTDLNNKVIIYNQTAAENFGYTSTDMVGMEITDLLLFSAEALSAFDSNVPTAEIQEIICRNRMGGKFPSMLVYSPLGVSGCAPVARLYFVKDISESRNYQNMVVQLDRFATRGRMARDIAHEINNYLAILHGNLELLPSLISRNDRDKLGEKIDVMKGTVANITKFTEGLSRFSDEDSDFRKEDLNQLVENLIAFVKPQNKFDGVKIESILADNIPLVEIDAGQLQVLLVNLLYNASEALAEADGDRIIRIHTSVDEDGEYFFITVTNSGPDISREWLPKLFVQRFSTKRKGTGLGLITCKNVVDNHRGEIAYHLTESSIPSFVIKIPVRREVARSSELQPDHAADIKLL